jgi:hypothetical protein
VFSARAYLITQGSTTAALLLLQLLFVLMLLPDDTTASIEHTTVSLCSLDTNIRTLLLVPFFVSVIAYVSNEYLEAGKCSLPPIQVTRAMLLPLLLFRLFQLIQLIQLIQLLLLLLLNLLDLLLLPGCCYT